MESAFSEDFRAVRIHTGEASERLNTLLHSREFTSGTDIFFGANQFRPESSSSQRLLAHELAHTLQQRRRSGGVIRRAPSGPMSTDPDTADAVLAAVDSGSIYETEEFADRVRKLPNEERLRLRDMLAGSSSSNPEIAAEMLLALDSVMGTPSTSSDSGSGAEDPMGAGACPARERRERSWAKAQPLDFRALEGDESLRAWALSGFPIDEGEASPSQGDLWNLLTPLFNRLVELPPESSNKSEGAECTRRFRKVRIMGSGDCHAPELNASLKLIRSYFVAKRWPGSLRDFLVYSNDDQVAIDEATFGEFPAKRNTTKEDRARNRGVVFIEGIYTLPMDPFDIELEKHTRDYRVLKDLREIYFDALQTIPNGTARCILDRVTFLPSGLPEKTYFDAFLRPMLLTKLGPDGIFPPGAENVGARIFAKAVEHNIFKPSPHKPDITICGEKRLPPEDPKLALRQMMLDVCKEVYDGVAAMEIQMSAFGSERINWWQQKNIASGGIYGCFDPHSWSD